VDTSAASDALARLDSTGIQSVLTEKLDALQQALPGPPVTLCVLIAGDDTARFIGSQMNGVTGVTAGSGRVILLIDPGTVSDDALRYTLAHEYHHSWWTSNDTTAPSFTLLDGLIFEGRADAFARLQHPAYIAPWTDRLTSQQVLEQWSVIQPQLDSQDPLLHQSVMFGGGQFSQWTGYAVGNEIVQDFIAANPDSAITEWGLMKATDLLAGSGFAEP